MWFISLGKNIDNLGDVPKSDKMSYCKISWNLEAARLVIWIIIWLWNLTGALAALLPNCLFNFRVFGQFKIQVSWLWFFVRSYSMVPYWIFKQPLVIMECYCHEKTNLPMTMVIMITCQWVAVLLATLEHCLIIVMWYVCHGMWV